MSIISTRGTTIERMYLKNGLRIWNNEQRRTICEAQVKSSSVMFLYLSCEMQLSASTFSNIAVFFCF